MGFLLVFFRLTTRSGSGEALRWFVLSESESVMLIRFVAGRSNRRLDGVTDWVVVSCGFLGLLTRGRFVLYLIEPGAGGGCHVDSNGENFEASIIVSSRSLVDLFLW